MERVEFSVQKNNKRIAVRIKPAAERKIKEGHPWLFADSIRRQSHEGNEGDLAIVFDRKGRFLAVGLYDPISHIRVRILHQGEPQHIDHNWFQEQVGIAIQLRNSINKEKTTGYRVIHGENDGFPGLIVDRYAETLVVKLYSLAWMPHLEMIITSLFEHLPLKRVVIRFSRHLQKRAQEVYGLTDGQVVKGPDLQDVVLFYENKLLFEADVIKGQKTGFFLDQRENRERVEKLAAAKKVLNVFSYSGGFSLYAARGGSLEVTSLDLSRPALEAAEQNFQRNNHNPSIRLCKHIMMQGDAFKLLNELADRKQNFDLVILDPPSFARRESQVANGLKAYLRLQILGLNVLRGGGILVSSSCSSRISAEAFFSVAHEAADKLRRPITEIERTFQAVDHPISFAEGAYLKCLFARVG